MIRNIIAKMQGFESAEQRNRLRHVNSTPEMTTIRERLIPVMEEHTKTFFNGVARDESDKRVFVHDDNIIRFITWRTPDDPNMRINVRLEIEPRGEDRPRPLVVSGSHAPGEVPGLMSVSLLFSEDKSSENRTAEIGARLKDLRAFAEHYLSLDYDRFNPLAPGEYLYPQLGDALEPPRDPDYRSVTQIDKELRLLEDEVRASRVPGQDARDVPKHLEDALHAKHAERDENFRRSGYIRIMEYRGKWTRPQNPAETDQDLSP